MKALCTARFETTIMLQNVFLMLKFMIPFLLLPGCERYNVGEATANHPLKQQMLFVLRSLCHLHHLHTCHTSWHWLQYVIQGSVFPPCCLVQETMQLSYKLVWSCCYLWGQFPRCLVDSTMLNRSVAGWDQPTAVAKIVWPQGYLSKPTPLRTWSQVLRLTHWPLASGRCPPACPALVVVHLVLLAEKSWWHWTLGLLGHAWVGWCWACDPCHAHTSICISSEISIIVI